MCKNSSFLSSKFGDVGQLSFGDTNQYLISPRLDQAPPQETFFFMSLRRSRGSHCFCLLGLQKCTLDHGFEIMM